MDIIKIYEERVQEAKEMIEKYPDSPNCLLNESVLRSTLEQAKDDSDFRRKLIDIEVNRQYEAGTRSWLGILIDGITGRYPG